ncbi:MAG: mercury resistance system periplasmic binding protein MerP [Acidobacteriaceae bacterium]
MKSVQHTMLALASAFALSASAFAATRTVALDVPGMTCATCPITVKKALNKVPGVSKIDFDLPKKLAIVTFDDTRTNTQALVDATTNAGYPSKPETSK